MKPTTVKKSTDHTTLYINTTRVHADTEVNSVLKCEFCLILKVFSAVI